MKTPGAIATDALTGHPAGHTLTREEAWEIIHDVIEDDRAHRPEGDRHRNGGRNPVTLKNPEWVAEAVAREIPGLSISQAIQVVDLMIDAVRYDRAQIIADMAEVARQSTCWGTIVYVREYAERLEEAS